MCSKQSVIVNIVLILPLQSPWSSVTQGPFSARIFNRRERGNNQEATCIRTTASEDPEEPSDASGKLGLFTGQGTFGRGRSFGGEVMLLARSTGQLGSRPRRAEFWVDGSPGHNKSCG